MKKITFALAFVLCHIIVCAQQDSTLPTRKLKQSSDNMYCVSLKDGKSIVLMSNIPIKNDIMLKNGNKLTTTGTLIKKNGDTHVIKPGNCVDQMGNEVENAISN